MAYAAVISVKKTIENLLHSPRISLAQPSPQIIESAYKELNSLQEILQRLDKGKKSDSRKNVNALDSRIKEAVWKLEDLLESHVYDEILPQSERLCGDGSVSGGGILLQVNLQELRDEVDSFIKVLKEKEEEYIYELDNPFPEEEEEAAVVSSTTDSGANKFKMIGSSDLLSEMRVKLQPHCGFAVLPVFGMADIGKTTIAKELFNDPLVFTDLDFGCRAWVTIGRKYKLDKLIRDILIQLDPTMDPMIALGGEEEGLYLKEILKIKRCLVVLDDIWDNDVWDLLKSWLPDYGNARSRVVLTTRLKEVARHVDQRWHAVVYTVELLNKDESWDLLREKVFGEEDCPPQFDKAGRKIAEKCDGLPLMIVRVAALLLEAERTTEYWEQVAQNKNSEIFMAAYDQLSEVLFPSYEYLPQHLKPCFLQMGVFPQNYEISQFKLLSMWIAEGFLEPEMEQTVEECAQRCLAELTDHSVVIRCQISSKFPYKYGDDIKTCRLQSSFWHLCNKEATVNKFFRVLSSRADGFQESLKNQRRLSFHNNILFSMNDVFESVEDACASTARSLLCYGPYYPYQVPICFGLRLVKVLDALQIRFYEFPLQALQQVYLRYLALTCNGELPASISKLWNLQFLIIERNMRIKSSGVTSYVPLEIWDMKEVKHIQVRGSNLQNPSGTTFSLESLLTPKGVGAETCTKEVLERIPNVTKLKVEIELHPNDSMNVLHCLNHVHVLSELLSLKCVVVNPKLRSGIVGVPAPLSMFPESLKKLHLSGLGYPWKYMKIIGSLPSLEVLKLQCYAFRGPKWEVERGIFRTLRYLVIEGTDLVQFRVKRDAFPWLGTLCFKHCYKLQNLRWESRSYPSKVEVIDCSSSTVNFANDEMRSKGEYSPRKPEDVRVESSWDDGKKLK